MKVKKPTAAALLAEIERHTSESAAAARLIAGEIAALKDRYAKFRNGFIRWAVLVAAGAVAADHGAPPLIQWGAKLLGMSQ